MGRLNSADRSVRAWLYTWRDEMNFLIIYFKNGEKVYYNTRIIVEFYIKVDKSLHILFSGGERAVYDHDRDANYDKWELI